MASRVAMRVPLEAPRGQPVNDSGPKAAPRYEGGHGEKVRFSTVGTASCRRRCGPARKTLLRVRSV